MCASIHKNQGKNCVITKEQKHDEHGMSFQSTPCPQSNETPTETPKLKVREVSQGGF